jgi:ACT domain-containing protein
VNVSEGSSTVREEDCQSYTIRLELADRPGELLSALGPIAELGGNLLSIYHERGNLTPRGRIPVEVDLECPPDRFEEIVDALRDAEVNVVRAGHEAYGEQVTVLLVGHIVDTDLSDSLSRIESCSAASVVDFSLSAPEGTDEASSARVRLAVEDGRTDRALSRVREVADEKDLRVITPLVSGGEA